MRKLLAVCVLFLGIFIVFVSFSAENFRDGFVRLHIIAESDGEYDQSVKLRLRDEVLAEYSERLSEYGNIEEAKDNIALVTEDIEDFCNMKLREMGVEYSANVFYENEYYPNRVYENVSLPAGTYSSLKIVLGEGEGQNWWCVLFPPLCLDAAKGEEAYISAGLSKDDYQLIKNDRTNKYQIKFKIFEHKKSWH
jgi:stage II sporulation protein R